MANESASLRPTYTEAQLNKYFQYIGIDEIPTQIPLPVVKQLPFLTKLVRYQLCKIPFEDLDLHYSVVKEVSLDTDYLFHRIVEQAVGRGGYCMQLNGVFARVLRSLGYTVITLGGRVSSAAGFEECSVGTKPEEMTYGNLGHHINLVIIDGKKYFCDVGFGNGGPTFPVPLEDGFSRYNTGSETNVASSMKLIKAHIASNTARGSEQLLWQYWIKYGAADDSSKAWIPLYCFSETEFFPGDFEVLNWFISTHKKSIFLKHVICAKFIMSECGQSLIGDVTLNGTVMKERRFGKSHIIKDCKTEQDRTDALQASMGVTLSDTERGAIKDCPGMIQ